MTRLTSAIAIAALVLGAAACDDKSPNSPTETVKFTAQLSPANEVPPVTGGEASGAGTANITFNLNRDNGSAITSATADFSVSLSGFPAATALTAAHIHPGAVGTNGTFVVNTGLVAGEIVLTTGSGTFTKAGISMTPALAQEIIANPAAYYFNVHSTLNPGGVARGQLVRQ
jgi:hypothetical protein